MSGWKRNGALAGLAAWCSLAMAATVPGDSLYQLREPLADQNGKPFQMAELAGKPALLTMFYGSCQLACPLVIHNMQTTMAALPPAARGKVEALLISLNPREDKVVTLKQLAKEHGMDGAGWLWLMSDSDEHTRGLAASLGIRYRRLESGAINHSTRILLLDGQGRIAAAVDDVGPNPDPTLVAKLRALAR